MKTYGLPDAPDVSLTDLAQRLGVHRASLSEWVRRGLVSPGFRVGSSRRWVVRDATAVVWQDAVARRIARSYEGKIESCGPHRWACPACGEVLRGSRSLCVRAHLRLCSAVWLEAKAAIDKIARPPSASLRASSPVAAREALRAMAERAIDGDLPLATFTIAVQRRLDRIAEIEDELRRLRQGEVA